MQLQESSTPFDCLAIQFYYDHAGIDDMESEGYTESFYGHDTFGPKLNKQTMVPYNLYTDQLDKNIDLLQDNPTGSWTVNTAKSYKLCPSIGNCVFNAHFFRNFVTGDMDDYDVYKGTNRKFEVYGFAAKCGDSVCATVDDDFYVVGETQNIYLENLTPFGIQAEEAEL